MDIIGIVRSIEPVFTRTHELARTVFHIDGTASPFIAFGAAAQRIYGAAFANSTAHVIARSRVTLRESGEMAFLVDVAETA